MRPALAALLFVSLSFSSPARANPDDADTRGIRQAALDYIEGWYQGDVKRMTRAVHPELAKRIVRSENGVSHLDQMGASRLIQNVRGGGGKETPAARQQKEITILDHYQNAASVKIVASDWIDYLHLAKVDGRWVIVNVLWEIKTQTQAHKH